MKNNVALLGVIFGIIMAAGLITINSIEANHISIRIIVIGLISASVGGLIFGIFMKIVFKRGDKIQIDIRKDETILKEALANHIKNHESVGGKLFLTNKRLIFKSHKINIQKHIFELDLNEINSYRRYKTMGMIPNGLKITTNDNLTEKFVVNKPNEWITQFEKMNNTTRQKI